LSLKYAGDGAAGDWEDLLLELEEQERIKRAEEEENNNQASTSGEETEKGGSEPLPAPRKVPAARKSRARPSASFEIR
jgi:hypothetical protein